MATSKRTPEPSLTIRVRELMRLTKAVLPCAGKDDMLPVLTCVLIEAHGPWLVASATDRFRIGMQRIKAPVLEGDGPAVWPEFKAMVPRSTLAAIFQLFKPTRGFDPEVTLTIVPTDVGIDGHALKVESAGTFDALAFTAASITYPLMTGEFLKLASLVREALGREADGDIAAYNWHFLADFKAADPHGTGLAVKVHPMKAAIITDGEDFIGVLMPRRMASGASPSKKELVPTDWHDILEPPATTKTRAKAKAS